jgi:hypothetical protein
VGTLPTIRIEGIPISRLIVGGNPFSGGSHQTAELSREMRDYHTVERIKATLRECESEGINTFLGRADNHIQRLLVEYWNEGGAVQWIAQTCPERASAGDNLRQAAATGARLAYLHGGHADRLVAAGELEPIRELLSVGRDLGLVMGVAGHDPETHRAVVEAGLGAQFHCCSFYNLGGTRGETYLPEDRERMIETIQQLPVPVIGYKIMAAGRNEPESAFAYAFSRLRPSDAVCVGVYTRHRSYEIRQNADLTRRFGG